MQADKLNLNANKTELMLIGTRQQLSKVNLDSLSVGDTCCYCKQGAKSRSLVWLAAEFYKKHVLYPFVYYTKLDALESTFRTRVYKH